MTEEKECKHEWRQKFISIGLDEEHNLYSDGYYCIHCLKHKPKNRP